MKSIAVLTPCKSAFLSWVNKNKEEGTEYKRVSKLTHLCGCRFTAIVETPHSGLIDPVVIESAYLRLI